MSLTYDEALDFLFPRTTTIKFGLANTRALLKSLGNPHEVMPSIHIGGTNGKGSVSTLVAAALRESEHETCQKSQSPRRPRRTWVTGSDRRSRGAPFCRRAATPPGLAKRETWRKRWLRVSLRCDRGDARALTDARAGVVE